MGEISFILSPIGSCAIVREMLQFLVTSLKTAVPNSVVNIPVSGAMDLSHAGISLVIRKDVNMSMEAERHLIITRTASKNYK